MAEGENLYPIAILIDELKHDDVQFRLNAMKRLESIAVALGPSRTREELIPFLVDSVDDEDEVLLVLAEQIGGFIQHVGGREHAHVLLMPLEALAAVEEPAVREKAVASINTIIVNMTDAQVVQSAWPLISRLGNKEWFTSRTSAVGLLAHAYARLPPRPAGAKPTPPPDPSRMDEDGEAAAPAYREDALALFNKLCVDDTPMVRRVSARCVAEMGTAIAGGSVTSVAAATAAPPPPVNAEAAAAAASTRRADEDIDMIDAGAPAASAGRASSDASGVGSSVFRDGYNVDTGDISSSAVPPPVPRSVTVDAASPDAGARAASLMLPIVAGFARDEQDSVRLLAVDGVLALARLLNGGMGAATDESAAAAAARLPEVHTQAYSLFLALANDASWRVRWNVANRFSEACEAAGRVVSSDQLLPTYERLMGDVEAEVRTTASYRVADVCRAVGKPKAVSVVLPAVEKLVEDASEHVRAALASVILGIAPVLGQDTSIQRLLPMFLRLLKDASAQVRLNIISRLEAVNVVIGLEVLSQSLMPAITELSSDKQWRVRLAIIEFMPLLAKQLGSTFFDTQLTDLCVKWLLDPVFAIREAAAVVLRKLTEVFGFDWAETAILPRIVQLQTSGDAAFLQRMTALSALAVRALCGELKGRCIRHIMLWCLRVQTIGDAASSAQLTTRILPAIAGFAKDPVPNIRFNVAKAFQKLSPQLDPTAKATIARPVLSGLATDADEDVRYYATRAMAACGL